MWSPYVVEFVFVCVYVYIVCMCACQYVALSSFSLSLSVCLDNDRLVCLSCVAQKGCNIPWHPKQLLASIA